MTTGGCTPRHDHRGRREAAVVSDGSALRECGAAVELIVREFAEHLSGLAEVPVRPVTVEAVDAAQLGAGIRALPADVGPVLVTHADLERTRLVQQDLHGSTGLLVLTDQDATAIALTAAVLSAVADGGRRAPAGGRVVVAGAHYVPILPALLAAAGVADITTWNASDAVTFPLRHVMYGADALVDLVGALPGWVAEGRHSTTAVITRGDARTAPCVAAGLLRAAVCDPDATFDVVTYLAAARALTTAPPPLTQRKARILTNRVADAVKSLAHTAR